MAVQAVETVAVRLRVCAVLMAEGAAPEGVEFEKTVRMRRPPCVGQKVPGGRRQEKPLTVGWVEFSAVLGWEARLEDDVVRDLGSVEALVRAYRRAGWQESGRRYSLFVCPPEGDGKGRAAS
jgi:hypothetical protein